MDVFWRRQSQYSQHEDRGEVKQGRKEDALTTVHS